MSTNSLLIIHQYEQITRCLGDVKKVKILYIHDIYLVILFSDVSSFNDLVYSNETQIYTQKIITQYVNTYAKIQIHLGSHKYDRFQS